VTLWTVKRMGADPRNQPTHEHMLALVEAPDRDGAFRAALEAPGVTLYPGQAFRLQAVNPASPTPRRVERGQNANQMRERLVDGYDAWVVGQGSSRLNQLHPTQRAYASRRPSDVVRIVALSPEPSGAAIWVHRETAWLLRQRDTGKLIYVIDIGVWRASASDAGEFARFLCGPYRRGVLPHQNCLPPDNHQVPGWVPLKDRSYDAVAIARRVGEDRVKVLVLEGHEHWYDNQAHPATSVPRITVRERWMESRMRRFTSFQIGPGNA